MTPSTIHPYIEIEFADKEGHVRPMQFLHPVEMVVAHHLDEVIPALARVEALQKAGFYAVGYISYEAAPAFDPALQVAPNALMPLLWFGVFREPTVIQSVPMGDYEVGDWAIDTDLAAYSGNIDVIRKRIADGETYQVNYTVRCRSEIQGDDYSFYRRMQNAQRGSYGAYMNLGKYRILSASPELFFRVEGRTIFAKPMKGTMKRGLWATEDERMKQQLSASEKDQAENLMIVDLLRNDIGRVAVPGTVSVPSLFDVETYRTVHQMTSTVTAQLRADTTLVDLMCALFPCGSVTGAPKVSTMRIIAELEDAPREVYCGTIGILFPNGDAVFNVPIRTVVVDRELGRAVYGVGSGITWDSTAPSEYREVFNKVDVLIEPFPDFGLIETLRLEDGTFFLLERHLKRLRASIDYFVFEVDFVDVLNQLEQCRQRFLHGTYRVRLVVYSGQTPVVECYPMEPTSQQQVVTVGRIPVSSKNRFLYHKTTIRTMYEENANSAFFDVLLCNEFGQVTEFTRGNLVLELDGSLYTPAQICGLLAGTLRDALISEGTIQERILTMQDLDRATRMWLINSVRGWVDVKLSR